MKLKHLIAMVILGLCINGFSQTAIIKNINKIEVGAKAYFARFGDNSQQLLLSGENYKGLVLFDRNTKTTTEISSADGAGSKLHIEKDGLLSFSENAFIKGRKKTEIKIYNLKTQSFEKQVTRNTNVQVSTRGKQLLVTSNGEKRYLTPINDRYLLWASLSPAQTVILFTAAGDASYICDLQGNIIRKIGYLNAPSWVDNRWVVGMKDQDDGHSLQQSDIYVYDTHSGKEFYISSGLNAIAVYPSASPDGKSIVFTTINGEVYIADIELTNN